MQLVLLQPLEKRGVHVLSFLHEYLTKYSIIRVCNLQAIDLKQICNCATVLNL